MRLRLFAVTFVLVLAGAACSSDNSVPPEAASEASSTEATPQAESAATTAAVETDTGSEDAEDNVFAKAAAGGASATLTLDNGETFTFNILCALEPQEAAGQEILFTVSSYDKPISLDVSQFGGNSLGGTAVISLYDAETFDNVWESNTLYGTELVLELEGNTVTGHGVFLAGEDPAGSGVTGVFEANC